MDDKPILQKDLPFILVTNDDGVESPGLLAVVEAVSQLGQVFVTAPTTQQTARGRGMIGNHDDFLHPIDLPIVPESSAHPVHAWHIDASPALIIRHALAVLCTERLPDLVVSGINYGENVGIDIGASGTLGAAFQAAAQGIPALAISRQTEVQHHFVHGALDWSDARRVALHWGRRVLNLVFDHGRSAIDLPFDVLKVDVPDPCPEGTEERLTRLSRQCYLSFHVEDPALDTPLRAAETRIVVDPKALEKDDDIYALAVDGVIAVTPLSLDNTSAFDGTRAILMG